MIKLSDFRLIIWWLSICNLSGLSQISFGQNEEKPIRVVTTLTDLSWAAQEILGPLGVAESLLQGKEDPHFVDARPDYIFKVTKADLVCFVGLDLEVGWLPKVLSKSGNAKVQPGGPGHCDLSKNVIALEKPTLPVDRSMGDVHAFGNPHYWLSPSVLAQSLSHFKKQLTLLYPKHAVEFEKRYQAVSLSLLQLEKRLKGKIEKAVKEGCSPKFYEYHKDFSYWAASYGLESLGSLEEKPGVPPNAGRLATVALQAKNSGAKVVLATIHAPRRDLAKFEEMSGLRVMVVPVSIQPNQPDFDSYLKIQENLVDKILGTLKP